ncbi:hypothetical protein EJB05_28144, partial [Eragrostis curvula]
FVLVNREYFGELEAGEKRSSSKQGFVRSRSCANTWSAHSIRFDLVLTAVSYMMFPRLTLPDGSLFSVPDNVTEHLSLAPGTDDARCCSSLSGGWLVLVRDCRSDRRDHAKRVAPRHGCRGASCCCFLVNIFSKAIVPLPELAAIHHEIEASIFIDKIVASKDPDNGSCLFAVMIHGDDDITLCRPGKGSCVAELDQAVVDMVFSNGSLFVLTEGEGLYVLELAEGNDGKPVVSTVEQLIGDCHYPSFPILDIWGSQTVEERYLRHYLVESCGQLLMVRRWLDDPYEVHAGDGDRTLSFEVFKLNSKRAGWMEQKGLDGKTLLLSMRGSVLVSSSSCEGARADCIYFVYDAMARQAMVEDPFHDSGVYSMMDSTMMPFPRAAAPCRGRWFPTWLSVEAVR